MLTAEDTNAIEDWISRLEAAARQISEAADVINEAARKSSEAALTFSRATKEIPSYIRTGP